MEEQVNKLMDILATKTKQVDALIEQENKLIDVFCKIAESQSGLLKEQTKIINNIKNKFINDGDDIA